MLTWNGSLDANGLLFDGVGELEFVGALMLSRPMFEIILALYYYWKAESHFFILQHIIGLVMPWKSPFPRARHFGFW